MQNKVVIITGASSGIGKALVYEFAKRGAKIAMGARNLDELHKIETDLKSRGVDALSVQTDVTREADCKNLIEKTVDLDDRATWPEQFDYIMDTCIKMKRAFKRYL